MGKRGLGRGLDALISLESEDVSTQPREIKVTQVRRKPGQPRQDFSEEKLGELAASIREHGVLQPILVRPVGEESYEVIAGERRLRAAEKAGLERIPAIVREMGDREATEIALIENLQREDLTAVEEARAYRHMTEEYGYTQEELARRIGKSRSHIANTMRILNLCEEVIEMIEKGELSAGHARAILATGGDRESQLRLARAIMERGLSVREAEKVSQKKGVRKKVVKPPEIVELEERLQARLGTRANLLRKRKGGRIEIFFYDDEDLARILDILDI
ncbi:MAG: ParB/RepB/Spo0J family partition protein [Syntrophomonadaceae bacterium]|nr:ParB/RepB/Spo0J family partition protein [Syntrophomonadaceae bacterium]